ncbi:hypothetical protein CEE37_13045 [candidate division LCP-89 bacterium B3_LCP]|uniref:Right handed beta helix domain-containing protein n=1 Tax=candidate division LCP-89 bacterium B3_LCP TaxID=2012998 RepID=A0A532UU14_UNCL8|nr:MAG: hypothetical protein CEE37_13045 [candidate division LCP-89 bacterium B3_LCP]
MKKIIIVVMVLALVATSATATVLSVPDSYSTIQAGINAANEGDTVIVADGVYEGTGNCAINYYGKSIVVMSENGPDDCIITCGGQAQGFIFISGETNVAVLQGFTVTSGSAINGGGIHIANSSPTIMRCIFWNNNAGNGGGVYVNSGDPRFINCTICQNSATSGGAIYLVNSDMVINSCIIAQNSASG